MATDQSLIRISASYGNVLQVDNGNDGIDGTLRPVSDLKGDESALSISTTVVSITGTLQVVGTILQSITVPALTSATTLDTTHSTVLVDVSGGTFITTLPPAASAFDNTLKIGRIYTWMKFDSSTNAATLKADGSELINDSNTFTTVTQFNSIKVQTNGTLWVII